jgi:hypothetical protein
MEVSVAGEVEALLTAWEEFAVPLRMREGFDEKTLADLRSALSSCADAWRIECYSSAGGQCARGYFSGYGDLREIIRRTNGREAPRDRIQSAGAGLGLRCGRRWLVRPINLGRSRCRTRRLFAGAWRHDPGRVGPGCGHRRHRRLSAWVAVRISLSRCKCPQLPLHGRL